jgi:hypothetical protein
MSRRLSPLRRLVCVPAGVLWLGVIALLAVPVIIIMTAFYYLWLGGRSVAAGLRVFQGARDEA